MIKVFNNHNKDSRNNAIKIILFLLINLLWKYLINDFIIAKLVDY